MWRVDLHVHTHHSKDSLARAEDILRAARRAGLDKLAITDHNSARGAFELAEKAPDLILPGEEILTTHGELLAFFIKEEIPAGLSPQAAIGRLRAQGAVISVSHPFDRFREGAWRLKDLAGILDLLDAVEGLNARCLFSADNRRAAAFAEAHGLAQTAGSDAHAPVEVGRAGLLMASFAGAEEFRAALGAARTFGRPAPAWVHLLSRYAALRKQLGLQLT
jgi:predicted metal-dependent phosphoesterase TrpH